MPGRIDVGPADEVEVVVVVGVVVVEPPDPVEPPVPPVPPVPPPPVPPPPPAGLAVVKLASEPLTVPDPFEQLAVFVDLPLGPLQAGVDPGRNVLREGELAHANDVVF